MRASRAPAKRPAPSNAVNRKPIVAEQQPGSVHKSTVHDGGTNTSAKRKLVASKKHSPRKSKSSASRYDDGGRPYMADYMRRRRAASKANAQGELAANCEAATSTSLGPTHTRDRRCRC